MSHSELSEKLWILDTRVAAIVKSLPQASSARQAAKRFKSSTTSFARYFDKSGSARHRVEFVRRLTLALKKLRETRDCLRLIARDEDVPSTHAAELLRETRVLCRVLGKFVRHAQAADAQLPFASSDRRIELSERLWVLDARIVKTVDALPESSLARHVADELKNIGTSFAPSFDDSSAAPSDVQAAQALSLALAALRETRGRLRLIAPTALLRSGSIIELIDEATRLCRTLGQSLRRARAALSPRLARFEASSPPLPEASSSRAVSAPGARPGSTGLWLARALGSEAPSPAQRWPLKTRFA